MKPDDRFIQLIERSASRYKQNGLTLHAKLMEEGEAVFVERVAAWRDRYRPYGLLQLRDLAPATVESPLKFSTLNELVDISADFISTAAYSFALALRAKECEIRRAIKFLDDYIEGELMDFVYETAWKGLASPTRGFNTVDEGGLKWWRFLTGVVHREKGAFLHPILEHGRPETTVAEAASKFADWLRGSLNEAALMAGAVSSDTRQIRPRSPTRVASANIKPAKQPAPERQDWYRRFSRGGVLRPDGRLSRTNDNLDKLFTDVIGRLQIPKGVRESWSDKAAANDIALHQYKFSECWESMCKPLRETMESWAAKICADCAPFRDDILKLRTRAN